MTGFAFVFLIAFTPSAFAQSTSDAATAAREQIEQGRKQLQENNYPGAASTLTQVIRNEHTPPDWMAIAFFYRGISNRMSGKNNAAIADFINALWLETLPTPIQAQAYYHRAHSYAALSKVDEALADLEQAALLAPHEERIAQARTELLEASGRETTASTTPSSELTLENRAAIAARPSLGDTLYSQPQSGASSMSSQSPVTPTRPARQISLQPETRRDGIRIQLGALGSQAVAEAEWQRISQMHRDVLDGLSPRYEIVTRDGKSMVRLQAGPAASLSSARNLCALLQGRGQDCITVPR